MIRSRGGTVYDHHVEKPGVVFSETASCLQAWDVLQEVLTPTHKEHPPALLEYIAKADIHHEDYKNNVNDTRTIVCGFQKLVHSQQKVKTYREKFFSADLDYYRQAGEILTIAHENSLKLACRKTGWYDPKSGIAFACSVEGRSGLAFKLLEQFQKARFAVIFYRRCEYYYCCVRSVEGRDSVVPFVKKYGGGGHHLAGGCKLSKEQFESLF